MFHAKIDLKLKVVMATINRFGRPRSKTRIIRPATKKANARSADRGASGL